MTILVLLLAACGSNEPGFQGSKPTTPTTTTTEEPPFENSLVFLRLDGSVIEMPGRPVAWCGPDDAIPGTVLQVAAITGVKRTADEWFSYWHVWATPDDVGSGEPISFPLDPAWGDMRGAQIFVGDSETENEASTAGEDSTGQIVFTKASCDVGAPVEFNIDAVIDSEFFDGDPVEVKGKFSGVLGPAPEG